MVYVFVIGLGWAVVWLAFEVRSLKLRVGRAEGAARSAQRLLELRTTSPEARWAESSIRAAVRDAERASLRAEMKFLHGVCDARMKALARALGWEYREAERSLPGWHRIKKGGA